MALQTSGAISLTDIANEQGISTTNMSLRSMSAYAGLGTPDAITEFYGYKAPSDSLYYYLLQATFGHSLVKSSAFPAFSFSTTSTYSWSFWVQQNGSGTANQILCDFVNTLGNSTNRFFIQYHSSLNRIIVRLRTNSVNYGIQVPLHNNSSATGTGSSSSNNWSSSNRGNTNAEGWTLLTVTYDASQSTPSSALKLYWNETQLTSSIVENTGSRTGTSIRAVSFGNNAHNYTTTAGAADVGLDEFKIYSDVLTSSEVSDIYNEGTIGSASATHSSGLLMEWTFEEGTTDSGGYFPTTTNDTGAETAH